MWSVHMWIPPESLYVSRSWWDYVPSLFYTMLPAPLGLKGHSPCSMITPNRGSMLITYVHFYGQEELHTSSWILLEIIHRYHHWWRGPIGYHLKLVYETAFFKLHTCAEQYRLMSSVKPGPNIVPHCPQFKWLYIHNIMILIPGSKHTGNEPHKIWDIAQSLAMTTPPPIHDWIYRQVRNQAPFWTSPILDLKWPFTDA